MVQMKVGVGPPFTAVGVKVTNVPAQTVSFGDNVIVTDGTTIGLTVMGCVVKATPQKLVTVYLMLAVPAATPPTIPVDGVTVTTAVFRLLHVPPNTVLASDIVAPGHTSEGPEIVPATGNGITTAGNVETSVPQTLV